MTNKPFPKYSFLDEAAAEARKESRNYWAKGGAADTKYPRLPIKGWKIPLADESPTDKSIRDYRKRNKPK